MHAYVNGPIRAAVEEIESSWGWFVALGIALIVLGAVCIVGDVMATLATIFAFGWLLLIGAAIALVQTFRTQSSRGLFLSLLNVVLRGFTGYALLRYPLAGEFGLTLLLASFFIVGGMFRAIGAGILQFPQWGWASASGAVSVILGVVLLVQLPVMSLWFIGFAIGVDFVFDGTSLVALGTALRSGARDRRAEVA
jgi:uncharacterized membrane protein HdeD (DUF308 family)